MSEHRVCKLVELPGLTDYDEALQLQRRLARARVEGALANDILLLLEHPRVITLGRGARAANVTTPRELLRRRGVAVRDIERGGDVTYHGPGQLVGYPILDLRGHRQDLHWYLRQLEALLIRALDTYEIDGVRVPGYTGVWVQNRKIASIGVHVTRWITFHGFALNVTTDLADFDLIVPCGIDAVQMTSIESEIGHPVEMRAVAERVSEAFEHIFKVALERAQPGELG